MVPAVILAAGRSSRMGRPKALLPVLGETFVARLAASLGAGGVEDTLIVGAPDAVALQLEVERIGRAARFVPNVQPDAGQLSSLLAGLAVADRPGVRAVLVTPVDVPLVSPATVSALLRAFARTHAPIVRAVYKGAHGHPILFAREVFDDLRRADPAVGARAVVHAHEAAMINLETDDPGVVQEIDTPDDYRRVFGQMPPEL